MAKNRMSITLNLDLGKQDTPVVQRNDNSILVRELRSMRKDISKLSKSKASPKVVERKQKVVERVIERAKKSSNDSVLVSELRGLRDEIKSLPHASHAGGG